MIIVAGGKGLRMGNNIPKQFLPLNGKPMLMRTIERLRSFDSQMAITLVLPQNHHQRWQLLCRDHGFRLPHRVVYGGEERFFSVKNALATIPNGVLVGIHDGVRPFVSHATIENTFAAAEQYGCAVPAVPSADSVRIGTENQSTPLDRSKIFLVQTPQCFRSEIIKAAYNTRFDPLFTDDASVVEIVLKKEIHLTQGNRENIKITTPFDLQIAEHICQNTL